MKNYIAFLLLFIYSLTAIVPSVLLDEVWKVSSLVSHFKEHQQENPNMGFIYFLQLHYSQDFAAHQSSHDHSKLPLKDHNAACANVVIAMLTPDIDFNITFLPFKKTFFIKKQGFPLRDARFSSSSLFDIWQPPKQV